MRKSQDAVFLEGAGIIKGTLPRGRKLGWRKLKYDFIALNRKGNAIYRDEVGNVEIFPGTVIYVPASTWHCYDPDTQQYWLNYWMLFDGEIVKKFLPGLLPENRSVNTLAETKGIEENWEKINDIHISGQKGFEKYIYCLFHNIIADIYLQVSGIRLKKRPSHVENIMRKMNEALYLPEVDIKTLCMKEGIGYDNLRKLFKKETGMSPKQYFLDIKMNKAKSLLMDLSYNIKEISDILRFDDPYYFSRLFKKKEGCSPKLFRQRIISRR